MKNIYKAVTLATAILLTLASCGHAGAQNDKKAKGVTDLNSDTFKTKGYYITQE